jgi:4-hydroxy-2-oxoheptanedioate aldolase
VSVPPQTKLLALTGQVPARCFWLDLPSPMAAEIAGHVGVELCVIDTEHGQIGPETVAGMLRALDLTKTPALVRLGDAGAGRVKHALDAGAAGVLIPYIETVHEARAAVRAFCAPPLGQRGMATGVSRAAGFGAIGDYAQTWNDTGLLALQIETAKGLAAAPEIAALPGVDMLFFGPSDYSADQGLLPRHDRRCTPGGQAGRRLSMAWWRSRPADRRGRRSGRRGVRCQGIGKKLRRLPRGLPVAKHWRRITRPLKDR